MAKCSMSLLLFVVCLWACSEAQATVPVSDEYIAGYASAVLRHDFGVSDATLQVHDGVVFVSANSLGELDRDKVTKALTAIAGVRDVIIQETGDPTTTTPSSSDGVRVEIPESSSAFLPRGLLFAPLHADPRWPHFAAGYREYRTQNLSSTFAGNLGETFAIYRNRAPFGGQWEFGIQAGVFSIFNLDATSFDLVNADYTLGFLLSYRSGRFSSFLRLHHQSSHLGDEFILNNPGVSRINLSFEEVDVKLAYDVASWIRLYGGGGYLVHRDPRDVKRGTTQWGIELVSPSTYVGGSIRPVIYADFQANERSNWGVARSIFAGVRFENVRIGDRQIQLLGEYFAGPSPDGQFYTQHGEWFGVGFHFYF